MEEYNSIVRQYEDQVLNGEIVAGRFERLAVERQRRDLAYGHERGLYFDCEAGQEVLDFFEILNIGPGQPFVLMPWQMFELYVFYGWKNSEGKRRFRKKYKSIARKNGKTALESGQVLNHLVLEGLPRAEAYVSATTERQAKITFDDAIVILENTPDLQDVLDSTSTTIFHKDRSNGSKFQYLTSNPKTADGTRPSFYLIDEYHEFDDDKMIQKMGTGTMNREQPIGNIVTTRGLRKTTPCFINEQKLYIPILEGDVVADSTFVYIFSQDSEDEFSKPETWRKSNPALGTLLKLQDMISEKEDAVRKGQEAMNAFKALNLNMWVDAAVSFVSSEEWNSGAKRFSPTELAGKTCWAGLDMSQRGDFTALCLYFPPEGWEDFDTTEVPEEFEGKVAYPRAPSKIPGEHRALWWLWIPEETVEKRVENGLGDLRDWIEDGFVEVMEGNVIDPRVIEEKIKRLADVYQIHSLAYDPFNATSTAISINEYGIPARELKQTMPFVATPTRELEYLIKKKQLNHGFNPTMAWMARNAVPKKDMAGNIRIVKNDKRSTENVDGMAALVNALAMWMMHEHQATGGGVYTW